MRASFIVPLSFRVQGIRLVTLVIVSNVFSLFFSFTTTTAPTSFCGAPAAPEPPNCSRHRKLLKPDILKLNSNPLDCRDPHLCVLRGIQLTLSLLPALCLSNPYEVRPTSCIEFLAKSHDLPDEDLFERSSKDLDCGACHWEDLLQPSIRCRSDTGTASRSGSQFVRNS